MRVICDIDRMKVLSLNTLLNHRTIDLRVPANLSIIRIRSGVMNLFREFLSKHNFIEVSTPTRKVRALSVKSLW